MKPKFKLPGTKLLNVKCDILVSTSAFKFNLRRFIKGVSWGKREAKWKAVFKAGLTLVYIWAQRKRFLWDRGCMWWLFRRRLANVRGL
jgi:hypothetical protein